MIFRNITKRTFISVIIDRITYFFVKTIFGNFWKLEILLRGVKLTSIRNLSVIGRPIISLGFNSKLEIGEQVILMSSNRFCLSSSLYSPCKITTILKSALIKIDDNVSLNGTSIVCRSSEITIGSRTMIGPNVTIMDSPFHPIWPIHLRNFYPGNEFDKPVEIGEDVWIGAQVIILPGSKIGSGSVIGAGSIVRGDIPPNCFAAGSPAQVIRLLNSEENHLTD